MAKQSNSTKGDVACRVDQAFTRWLAEANCSLAVTTYQAGKLLLIGWDGQRPTLNARHFPRAMGIDCHEGSLALATDSEVRLFRQASLLTEDLLPDQPGRYDALYLEQAIFHTGDVFSHDLAFTDQGLMFVNTRFSCIATVSADYHFEPVWKPSFIDTIVPGDLCHLNGLAVHHGRLQTVTALGRSDTPGGWREQKAGGGIVIDTASSEIVLSGLAMPHSPRWYRDELWVLNSGQGDLLRVSQDSGQADVVCHLPTYLRGLAFHGDTAIVGLCKIREKKVFGGLPIEREAEQLLCGIALVDLTRGNCLGTFEFTAGVEEIYDIRVLPGIGRATIYDREHPLTEGAFTAPEFSYWIRAEHPS